MTTLTTAQFEQHMNDIAKFYCPMSRATEPARSYELPPEIIEAAKRSKMESSADLLHEWKQRMKTDNDSFSDTNQGQVTEAARQYKQDRDSHGFAQRIDLQTAHGKELANSDIDAWKAAGLALGHAHPDKQNEILKAFHDAVNFFVNQITNKITSFIMNAVENLIEWIATAFEVIGPYFAELVEDIAVFFLAL